MTVVYCDVSCDVQTRLYKLKQIHIQSSVNDIAIKSAYFKTSHYLNVLFYIEFILLYCLCTCKKLFRCHECPTNAVAPKIWIIDCNGLMSFLSAYINTKIEYRFSIIKHKRICPWLSLCTFLTRMKEHRSDSSQIVLRHMFLKLNAVS